MTTFLPKISVIVPVYNSRKYLAECVNSILTQTYTNIEVLLINDGSTDGSDLICDQLGESYENVKILHKANGGASSARNKGLDIATGEYIMFVDSDDTINENMLMDLYSAFGEKECDIVASLLRPNKESVDKPEIVEYDSSEVLEALFTRRIDCSQCTKLYKTELLKSVRFPEGVANEDVVFLSEVYSKIKQLIYVKKNYYYYRRNEVSVSHNVSNCVDMYENIEKIKSIVADKEPMVLKAFDIYQIYVMVDVCMKLFKTKSIHKYGELYNKCKTMLKCKKQRVLFGNFTVRFKLKYVLALIVRA